MFGFSKKVNALALSMTELALSLTKKLANEDKGNFICFTIFGLNSNGDVVTMKNATHIFIKILYCGSSVVSTWRYDYEPYDHYKSMFKLFEEENGDHSFCTKIDMNNSDVVDVLKSALLTSGFSAKVNKNDKSLYFSLL